MFRIAVFALVFGEVDVALVVYLLQDQLDHSHMGGVRGADEVVVPDVHPVHHLLLRTLPHGHHDGQGGDPDEGAQHHEEGERVHGQPRRVHEVSERPGRGRTGAGKDRAGVW